MPESPNKNTVLIIEGDAAFAQQLSDALSRAGYDPMIAGTGADALKAIFDVLPRLIILDSVLPGSDSYDILAKKHSETLLRTIPVFLLSSQANPINMARVPQGSVAEFVIAFKNDAADVTFRVKNYLKGTQNAPAASAPVAASSSAQKKILWVEDDKLIGTILAKKLVSSGFDLIHAKNGEEAMTALANSTPDAIVLDLMLPGMSGFDILQKVDMDPRTKAIPSMILSNLSKPSDIERAKMLGARKFVVKAAASLDQIVAEILELCASSSAR